MAGPPPDSQSFVYRIQLEAQATPQGWQGRWTRYDHGTQNHGAISRAQSTSFLDEHPLRFRLALENAVDFEVPQAWCRRAVLSFTIHNGEVVGGRLRQTGSPGMASWDAWLEDLDLSYSGMRLTGSIRAAVRSFVTPSERFSQTWNQGARIIDGEVAGYHRPQNSNPTQRIFGGWVEPLNLSQLAHESIGWLECFEALETKDPLRLLIKFEKETGKEAIVLSPVKGAVTPTIKAWSFTFQSDKLQGSATLKINEQLSTLHITANTQKGSIAGTWKLNDKEGLLRGDLQPVPKKKAMKVGTWVMGT